MANAEEINEISRIFHNAAVDEYNRKIGEIGGAGTNLSAEVLFAHAKLKVMENWVQEGRALYGIKTGAYEYKFN